MLLRDASVLIARRPADKHGAGLWEFPGGKVEPGEPAAEALARELREELGIEVVQAVHAMSIVHDYTERRVQLEFYAVERWSGDPAGIEGQAIKWCPLAALSEVRFLPANTAAVRWLTQRE